MGAGIFVLAFTLFDFVAAKVFLGLCVGCMFARYRIIFSKHEFVWGVLGVFDRVVRSVTRQVTYEANKLALCILLCHFFFLIRVPLRAFIRLSR